MKYEVKLKWPDKTVSGGFDAKWFPVEGSSPEAAKAAALAEYGPDRPGAEAVNVTLVA